MESSWQMKEGHLVCRWSAAAVQPGEYCPSWMQVTEEVQSGYLPPVPDFASHSPFGGASWFWFQQHQGINHGSE